MSAREEVLQYLATRLAAVSIGRPVRIAIDGRSASGKTTLADELATLLRDRGRPVIRTSIDGFHRPRAERYARGRNSAEGYYHDARDLDAVTALLLAPLGPGGDRLYRTSSFDLETDAPTTQAPLLADADAMVLVDGTFLQRPELRGGWDLAIFVKTSEQTAQTRGVVRDSALPGGDSAARQLYVQRYGPAYDLYDAACSPEAIADVLIVNEDFQSPALHVRPGARLVGQCG
jgi:uridine kinase